MPRNLTKRLSVWVLVVAVMLLLPYLAMRFNWQIPDPGSSSTDGVNWTLGDFIFAGILLFGSALTFELITKKMSNRNHRIIVGAVVAITLTIIWVGAATGFGFE